MAQIGPEPLQDHHDFSKFDCGRESLNSWLTQRALRSQTGGDARTFVVVDDETSKVVGYHALAAGSVAREQVPTRLRKNSPDPIPAIVLARLAVDLGYQRQGVGMLLLRDAIERSVTAADSIGARLLMVHSLDDEAAAFYEHFGFVRSPVISNLLLVRMDDVRQTLGL